MKTTLIVTAFFATLFAMLVPEISRAQGVPANPAPIQCTENWLKSAMGRLGSAATNMSYSGDLDADAVNAMMLISRAQSQAAAWEAKCGNNAKAKKKAQQMQWQAQSNAYELNQAEFMGR